MMMNQCLIILPPEYFHYPPSFQPKNFTFAALDMRRERKPKCAPQLFLESLLGTRRSAIKVMLQGTICNDDFQRNTVLQYCCDIVLNSYNTVPTIQRCTVKHHTLRSDNGDVHGNDPEKQTSHPFTFFHRDYLKSPSYSKRREFRLELKKGHRAQVQTEMVKFIGLPFPFSSNLKFGHFTSQLCRDGNEMYKKA